MEKCFKCIEDAHTFDQNLVPCLGPERCPRIIMNKCDICYRDLGLHFEPILVYEIRRRICLKCMDTYKAVKLALELDENNINNQDSQGKVPDCN